MYLCKLIKSAKMSRNDDMTIRFSGLKPGRYTYGFTLDDDFFKESENDELQGGKVEITADMERLEHMLMFTFKLKGELLTWCDRCLGELKVPVEGEEHLCVRFSDSETTDDENVVVLPEGAFEIDLAQWLYEYAAVRLPMQHIHEAGECDPETVRYIKSEEELASERRSESDPRWDALKGLMNDE